MSVKLNYQKENEYYMHKLDSLLQPANFINLYKSSYKITHIFNTFGYS